MDGFFLLLSLSLYSFLLLFFLRLDLSLDGFFFLFFSLGLDSLLLFLRLGLSLDGFLLFFLRLGLSLNSFFLFFGLGLDSFFLFLRLILALHLSAQPLAGGSLGGGIGLLLGILGALGLLQRRLSAHELRMYSAPADHLNLILFLVVFGCAFATFVWVDRDFSTVSLFVHNLVTFKLVALPGSGPAAVLPALSAILLAALTAYIPMTHMSHFVGKYFAYHAIRWNDEPNLAGGKQEKTIQQLLGQPITWAAPHIAGEGKKTWVDVATEEIEK